MIYIYGLWRKGEQLPFYVGQTTNVKYRTLSHRCRLRKINQVEHELRVVASVRLEEAVAEESRWINHFRALGAPLDNSRDGSNSGRPSKDVERFTTTLDRETLAWAKAHFGERGVGPWINAALQAERERVENEEIIARARAQKGNQ